MTLHRFSLRTLFRAARVAALTSVASGPAPALAIALAPAFAHSVFFARDASAQAIPTVTYPPAFNEPMPLHEHLGHFTRSVTTTSPQAQAFFDQGIRLIYSFSMQEAARSFREAQKRDSTCAMCYLGEAWAWGPYLNGALTAANAPRAHAAAMHAVRLRASASPMEQAIIDAMAVRYTPTHEQANRARLDTLYSNAMARVFEQYPRDLDIGTLYAESLMLLNRSRGNYEIDQPNVVQFHGVLDGLLRQDVHHPGACHLYIHATEATSKPELAEACALHLGSTIPGASHINHMPSHTFNRIGRWGDAVRSNIEAWHTDLRSGEGGGVAIYPTHNLHMLLYAASYDGQGAVAIQASRDYAKLVRGGTHYIALTMIRFGRFAEILELNEVPTNEGFRAQWEFARGYAHLRLGAADSARFYMARIDSVLGGTGAARNNAPANITAAILRAELLLHDGKTAEAITQLEAAVERTDGMPYAEPELLPFSARHWIGAVLLKENRASDAERIYKEDLVHHPRNGWSLHGLLHSLNAQGKSAEAEQVQLQLKDAWARSDSWIRASRL